MKTISILLINKRISISSLYLWALLNDSRRKLVPTTDVGGDRTYNSGQSRFTQVDPIGMASASIGNPQSLNLYTYVQNDPTNLVDPQGLLEASPSAGYCIRYHYTNGKIGYWGPWQCYAGTDSGGGGSGSASTDDDPDERTQNCVFPEFKDLTDSQKKLLVNGVETYSALNKRNKANFLKLTSVAGELNLDFGEMKADPSKNVDRLVLSGNSDALRKSVNTAINNKTITKDKPHGHDGMDDWGGRQNVKRNSLQVGGDEKPENGAFIDIDYYNPKKTRSFFGHVGEVLSNMVTGGKTDAFAVGRGLGSKVTKYKCDKAKNESMEKST
ncbi:MAG: RHS repeat-associated core domain-containing protein [Pyrinomonadaceae bacterium]